MRPRRNRGTRCCITATAINNGARPADWLRERAWELGAAALLAAIYIGVLSLLPTHVFWHPDEGGKFLQMSSIRWDPGIRTTLRYGGQATDPDLKFYPSECTIETIYPEPKDDTLRFRWPVWFPLATRPLYLLWGGVGLYIIPLACGCLTALLAATWVRPFSKPLAGATVLLVGLATPVTYYSFAFLEHTLATFLGMLGVWCLCRKSHQTIASAGGALLLMAAAALRIEMTVLAVAAGVGALVTRLRASPAPAESGTGASGRRSISAMRLALVGSAVTAMGIVGVWFLPARQWVILNELPRMLRDTRYKRGFLFESLRYLLINAPGATAAQATPGAETLALLALFVCLLIPLFGKRRWANVALLVGLAILVELSFVITLRSYTYMARQGLFTVAPFIVLAVFAMVTSWGRRDPALLLLAIAGATYFIGSLVLLFITRVGYSGDYLIGLEGPVRYVLALYPIWGALSVIGLYLFQQSDRPQLIRSGVTLLVLIAMAMSLMYQARGLQTLKHTRDVFARWVEELPRDKPLVTSEWWLAAAIAPYFMEHDMYCVPAAKQLGKWVDFARSRGISEFVFAARKTIESYRNVAAGLPLSVESNREVEGLEMIHLRIR